MTTTDNTQIAAADSALSLLPPSRPMENTAVTQLMEHAEAMQTAHRLASVMCNTAMVPAIYRGKPDDGAAAILYGAELGLNPIQSLQNIFAVHGQPSMYARTMVALVKRHGYRIGTQDTSDTSVTVVGVAPDGQSEQSTWTIERATQAGYVPTIDEKTGKYKTNANGKLIGNEKYLTQPREMLYAKAATEVCRHLAPDVLLGIAYSYEDLQDGSNDQAPRRVDVTVAGRTAADGLRELLGAPKSDGDGDTAASQSPAASAPQGDAQADSPAPDSAPPASKPTSEQYSRLNSYFDMADMGGKTAAMKAKRGLVTAKLLDRDNFAEQPLTGDDVETLIGLLDQLNNEGEGVLSDTLVALTTETQEA